MKKSILSLMVMCSTIAGAQTLVVRNTVATAEDYVLMLEQSGYKSFAFDLSSLKDETYWIEPVVKHYKDGKEVTDGFSFQIAFSSRDMLSANAPEYIDKLRQTGRIYDEEHGILSLCEKVRVGFAPNEDPCIRMMRFFVTDRGNYSIPLFFDPQIDPSSGEQVKFSNYGFREFVVNGIELGKFIPLAMCGSYWYDPDIEGFRFCGEEVLTEDMCEDLLKLVKDYYVVGMIIRE